NSAARTCRPAPRSRCGGCRIRISWSRSRCWRASRRSAEGGSIPMTFEGGCYCGKIRYGAQGEPRLKAQCHCRECQYISGGAPNMFMLMPPDGFRYVSGAPKTFARSDLEQPVTREFCETCGTHIVTRRPGLNFVVLKVGTLDDPSLFG